MADDELSCDISRFRQQISSKGRIGVMFVGKEFPGSEPFVNAVAQAYEDGYFGRMELGVIPVDSQECNSLAEVEKIEVLPTVAVYDNGRKIGEVSPSDADAKTAYKKAIERLIDLSEE